MTVHWLGVCNYSIYTVYIDCIWELISFKECYITWTLTPSSSPHQLWYQGASLPYPTAPGSHSHPFDAVKNHFGVWSCSCGPVQGSLPPPRIRSPDHLSVLSWTWGRKSLCYMDLQVTELVFSLIALRNIVFFSKCKRRPPEFFLVPNNSGIFRAMPRRNTFLWMWSLICQGSNTWSLISGGPHSGQSAQEKEEDVPEISIKRNNIVCAVLIPHLFIPWLRDKCSSLILGRIQS